MSPKRRRINPISHLFRGVNCFHVLAEIAAQMFLRVGTERDIERTRTFKEYLGNGPK